MPTDPKRASFEGFVHWLGERGPDGTEAIEPPASVRSAAQAAHASFSRLRRSHRQELLERVRGGVYYEELELLAAADADRTRALPRLRTANGFCISALYLTDNPADAAPTGLLVECPADMAESFAGQKVHVSAGGKWIELGEIDIDGKVTGDIPRGFEFIPPFGLRVCTFEMKPEELGEPGEPK